MRHPFRRAPLLRMGALSANSCSIAWLFVFTGASLQAAGMQDGMQLDNLVDGWFSHNTRQPRVREVSSQE
jgi:hypothetical protein